MTDKQPDPGATHFADDLVMQLGEERRRALGWQERLAEAEASNARLLEAIRDDAFAISFQSMARYREALLKVSNSPTKQEHKG